MNLPDVGVSLPVSETLPLLLHPVVVHLAVVLPLIILILELINLITKRKALSLSVYLLFVLLIAVFLAAYATGLADGKEAAAFLDDEGKEALKGHRILGGYLLYLAVLPLAMKVVTLAVKKGWSRTVYALSLVLLIALTFYQAKKGGELVYDFGANVGSQQIMQERVEQFEDAMEELKKSYQERIKALGGDINESNQTQFEHNLSISLSTVSDINGSASGSIGDHNGSQALKADINNSNNMSGESNSSK